MSWFDCRPEQIDAEVANEYSVFEHSLWDRWRGHHPYVDEAGHPQHQDLTVAERAAVMNQLIGPVANLMPAGGWHEEAYSPGSSQALAVLAFGTLKQNHAFSLLEMFGVARAAAAQDVRFEQRAGRTQFDVQLLDESNAPIATVECKYMEKGFNTCDYPNPSVDHPDPRCDGLWYARPGYPFGCPMAANRGNRARAARYWRVVFEDWGIQHQPPVKARPCPLRVAYQAAHNLAETRWIAKNINWLLVYDHRNPYFGGPDHWVDLLTHRRTRNLVSVTWTELFHRMRDILSEQGLALAHLHGFID